MAQISVAQTVLALLGSLTRKIMHYTKLFLPRFSVKSEIDDQIAEYIAYRSIRARTMIGIDTPIIMRFVRLAGVRSMSEITVQHVQEFDRLMTDQITTNYARERAEIAMRGLLKYFHRKGYLCPSADVVRRSKSLTVRN